MTRELRDPDAASRWMAAGLCLVRLSTTGPRDVSTITRRMATVLSESGALPPVGVLGDVGKLIGGASLDLSSPVPLTGAPLVQAIRAYEDQFLGRLAQDPRIESVADAIARLPSDLRDDAVALLVSRVLRHIGFDCAVSLSPGITRRVSEVPVEDLLETGFLALREEEVQRLLEDGYSGLVYRARRTGALVSEADVFVLENLTVLSNLTQRLAIEQIVEVSEELSSVLPRRMKPKSGRARRMPTNIEDEDRYPIGGFSSIATYGSFENLVTSELIYMEDGSEDVDLFLMRYLEGELLYYTRDESVFIRNRRIITFVFEPELVGARFKDRGLRWQRLVVAMGLVSAAVRKLSGWLSAEGLFFRVAFVRGRNEAPLESEKGLCLILLREWIDERKIAEVVDVDDIDLLVAKVNEEARTAQSDLVVFTKLRRSLDDLDRRVRAAFVDLSEPSPRLWWSDRPTANVVSDPDPWSAWSVVSRDLLQSMIDGR